MENFELQLAIAETQSRMEKSMDEKLEKHREVIEARLDSQDDKLDEMRQDLSALVGTDKVPGLIQRNTELLEGLVEKHERWREEAQQFKAKIETQVALLTEKNVGIETDLNTVRWFVILCDVSRKAAKWGWSCIADSKTVYVIITILFFGWVVVWHKFMTVVRWFF